MLLGRPPADFDVATDAVPEAVLALFGHTFAIPTGLKHGTVTVLTDASPRRPVEVTTFRGEGDYLDNLKSVHSKPATIQLLGGRLEASKANYTADPSPATS